MLNTTELLFSFGPTTKLPLPVRMPLIATLIPVIYNRVTPRLFDVPFFHWYQMAAIPLGVLCVVLVYRNTRGER